MIVGTLYRDELITKSLKVGNRNQNFEVGYVNEDEHGEIIGFGVRMTLPEMTLPEMTPDEAEAAEATIDGNVLALVDVGDVVRFEGNVFTKAAVPGEDAWATASDLAGLINALGDWGAVENSGDVDITAAVGGAAWNNRVASVDVLVDTTSGGDPSTPASATIEAAVLLQLAKGDTVEFAGKVFTKADATSVDEDTFEDAAGLITCINALSDWAAVDDSGDIDITAEADGEEYNDFDIMVTFNVATAGGVNGTPAPKGRVVFDSDAVYISIEESTIAETHWKKVELADLSSA
jgi:hypothetical protein